ALLWPRKSEGDTSATIRHILQPSQSASSQVRRMPKRLLQRRGCRASDWRDLAVRLATSTRTRQLALLQRQRRGTIGWLRFPSRTCVLHRIRDPNYWGRVHPASAVWKLL